MRPDRVLWVTASPPDHDGSGAQLRQAMLLDAVAERAPVTLVVAGELQDPRVRARASQIVPVEVRPAPLLDRPWHRRRHLARHLLRDRTPWETVLARPQRDAFAPVLEAMVRPGDVVLVEHLELAPLVDGLGHAGRTVLTIHHAAGRQAAHHLALAESARGRRWWRTQRDRVRALERWAGQAFDAVVTVSDLDASGVACASTVVPNAVDATGQLAPLPGTQSVVFTGTLDYGPNADGVAWFVHTAWPRVRTRVPGADLRIVGRRPGPQVLALADVPGVEVHADVPAIDPWLRGADVAVVPVRLGGGTRLKALQALAAGRPVVGTTIGLEGLGLVDGVHGRVADTPEGLADAVVELLVDGDRARLLAEAGRDHVARTHDWRVAGARLASVLGV